VATLDLPALIGGHIRAGEGNPDGIHFGWDGHRRVGDALAALLAPALSAESARRPGQ
jgi:lysophospholipase L1-like esterase